MSQASKLFGANVQLGKPGLAASGANTTYDIGTAFNFSVEGKAYNKGTVSGGATPTTDGITGAAFTALAASQGCAYVWCVNSSGTVKLCQGPVVDLDSSNAFKDATPPQFPDIPDSLTAFAYTVAKNGSTGSSWRPGSQNWNATGMTLAHQDVVILPRRPQTA